MRILVCLGLLVSMIASARADNPQRLSERPVPSIKLVAAPGWRLSAVAQIDVQNGVEILVIEGDVFNAGDSERPSPKVRLAVLTKAGQEIYHWTVLTELGRIKPGDYAPFNARLESPPEDAEGVMVSTIDPEASPP